MTHDLINKCISEDRFLLSGNHCVKSSRYEPEDFVVKKSELVQVFCGVSVVRALFCEMDWLARFRFRGIVRADADNRRRPLNALKKRMVNPLCNEKRYTHIGGCMMPRMLLLRSEG